MSFVPLVGVVILFWVGVFYVTFTAQGISVADFLLGRKAPLPADLGQWKRAGTDEEGRIREERRLLPGGQADPSFLILQVRFLDARSGEVVLVLPEQRQSRRRRQTAD